MKENINRNSISVIIPALNEEKRLADTVKVVSEAVKKNFDEYEIFIFNDGSLDLTGNVAENLAEKNCCSKVIHNQKSKCLGGVYKQGREMAKMNYLILVNGKCDTTEESLEKIFKLKGQADIIIPYTVNLSDRCIFRKILSLVFVGLLNKICGLKLRYYNHYVLHRREVVESIDIKTNSYVFQAEALIRLIKKGYTYKEVGVKDVFEDNIKTKAFRLKNVVGVSVFLFRIIYEIYFKRAYNKQKKQDFR